MTTTGEEYLVRKVLIATHGYLADGIKNTVGILTGKEGCITCVDAYVDESDYTPLIQSFIDGVEPEDEAVIFTDLYGGSVNQRVVQLKPPEKTNLFLITGFNLPVVLGVVLSDEPITGECLDEIVGHSAKQLLRLPKKARRVPQMSEAEREEAFFA